VNQARVREWLTKENHFAQDVAFIPSPDKTGDVVRFYAREG